MFTLEKLKKTTAALALVAASATGVAALAPVSDIDVTTESMAIADAEAFAFLDTLKGDLEKAISERVTFADETGSVDIHVDIRNISLNGTPVGPDAEEFNELDGVVSIRAAGTGNNVLSYPVQLAAYQAETVAPEGWIVVNADNGDFYTALVEAFAVETAEKLEQVNVNDVAEAAKVSPTAPVNN